MRTYPSRRRAAAIITITAVVALAGCGDDTSDGASEASVPAPEATSADTVADTVADTTAATTAMTTATTTEVTEAPTTIAVTEPSTSPTTADDVATSTPRSVDPEFVEYCAKAEEINSLDGFPSAEQMAEYEALAPDELKDDVATIAALLADAGDDPSALFADPAFTDAIGNIEESEGELCGTGGPTQDPGVTMLDPDATRVDVTASEYMFEVEFPTTAGRYSFVMANEGEEAHLMVLVQLEDDAVLEEVIASEGETGVITEFASDLAAPGQDAVLTADLEPGRWVLLCPLPDATGVPHFADGMIHEYTVIE